MAEEESGSQATIEYGQPCDIQVVVEYKTIKPFGNNLVVSEEDEAFLFGKVKKKERLERGYTLFAEKKRKQLRFRVRPRAGLEVKSQTFDILEMRPKGHEYHLGSLRHLKTSGLSESKWALLGYEDQMVGTFVEEGLMDWGKVKLPPLSRVWKGRKYQFFSGENPVGTVHRKLSKTGIRVKAAFDLDPARQEYVELLQVSATLFAVYPFR